MSAATPTLRIREAVPDDAGVLAPLLGQLGYPVEAPALLQRMQRMLARDDEIVLIAEGASRTGDALGLLALHVFPVLAYDADVAMIMALVVAEAARGLGVGRALIDRSESIARERGASRLLVTTHLRRADAHAFYERLGFEHTGRRYVRSLR